jgi:hypothetical protein
MKDTSSHRRSAEQKVQWYFSKTFIIVAIFIVGPFALPLIWCRPQTTLSLKIVITIGMLLMLGWIFWPGSKTLFFG